MKTLVLLTMIAAMLMPVFGFFYFSTGSGYGYNYHTPTWSYPSYHNQFVTYTTVTPWRTYSNVNWYRSYHPSNFGYYYGYGW